MPPSIGAAMRWVTSEPVEVLSMIGISPAMVESAVIATGRTRREVADKTASLIWPPVSAPPVSVRHRAISVSIKLSTNTPISAAIPARAINPTALLKEAEGEPIAILNHNVPTAYLVPAATYERMLERLEDVDLGKIVRGRAVEKNDAIEVGLDDL